MGVANELVNQVRSPRNTPKASQKSRKSRRLSHVSLCVSEPLQFCAALFSPFQSQKNTVSAWRGAVVRFWVFLRSPPPSQPALVGFLSTPAPWCALNPRLFGQALLPLPTMLKSVGGGGPVCPRPLGCKPGGARALTHCHASNLNQSKKHK